MHQRDCRAQHFSIASPASWGTSDGQPSVHRIIDWVEKFEDENIPY